ncbi:hypothetical protein [Levilactobacillus tujiorum]|uniref:Condensation domain-containing protein n=1 Tax=Levilactobacillus tujiorum TaxID=2912243 RepID=A0ABX1L3V8_9LACO|nr:hypothetical protein [Levilactobacillus tujiorum]MCH5464029.1 hypothetical protein [Levilactobacillus tujiorum]NLR11131.1 hypothetical protein [Lactobacillus sp. HBUAS51387]NLR29014.1 hypothetical protein [Levilactobacillus tujiorum]
MNENPLNILHTIGFDQLYPVIRCQLTFSDPLDQQRLVKAINLTAQVVPELFCRYEMSDNSWQPAVTDGQEVLNVLPADAQLDATPDWEKDAQVRFDLQPDGAGNRLTITMSHILTDGSGFKQYLYLLSNCYSQGERAIKGVTNVVNLDWLKTLLKQHPASAKQGNVDHPSKPLSLPQLTNATGEKPQPNVSGWRLTSDLTRSLINATHTQGVTVNDVLLTTFGKAVQAFDREGDELAIPCPTDMRQKIEEDPAALRIANHTARFNPAIQSPRDEPVSVSVQKMHVEMQRLKDSDQFLDSVRSLMAQYQTESIKKLQEIVEANYHVRAIAFTNFGIIDDSRLVFAENTVTNCLMTGSFRYAPMFQVACSTFKGQLSLGFNMIGTTEEVQVGRVVIHDMISRMKEFMAQAEVGATVIA